MAKKSSSEVTITMTVQITDVIHVPNDEIKAEVLVERERERLMKNIESIGADDIQISNYKVFPNIKAK
jgi:thymidylate synthase